MKKLLYTLGFLALGAAVSAQAPSFKNSSLKNQVNIQERMKLVSTPAPRDITPMSAIQNRDEVFFFSDFSDANEWVITDQGTPPAPWQIVTAAPAPYPAVNFPGAADGFAFAPGDDVGNNSVQNTFIRTANPVDLSDADIVILTFLQYTGRWMTEYLVEYSYDGVNWLNIPINGQMVNNDVTTNPEEAFINVTEQFANQPAVWFGFRYQANWGFWWAIDDVQLGGPLGNDMAMQGAWFGNAVLTDFGAETIEEVETWDDYEYQLNMEYTHYPKGLVVPLNFTAFAINNGTETQTNVRLSATVTTPSGVEGPFLSAEGVNLAFEDEALFTIENVVLDAFADGGELGEYIVNMEIISDQDDENPGNNSEQPKYFKVTEDTFANDSDFDWLNNVPLTTNRIIGTRYAFIEPATITHIKFAIMQSTTEGSTIISEEGESCFPNVRAASVIQPVGPNNPDSPIFEQTEIEYVVELDDINFIPGTPPLTYIIMELPEPVEATTDRVFQAEIRFPATVDDVDQIAIAMQSGRETFASVVRNFTAQPAPFGQGWFGLGDFGAAIRFVTSNPLSANPSIDQLKFNMSQNFPNPTFGETTINWELYTPAQNVRFSITDITGKTVFAKDLGERPAGKQEPLILDLNRFAAGVYQYGLTIGNERLVKKLVITK